MNKGKREREKKGTTDNKAIFTMLKDVFGILKKRGGGRNQVRTIYS